MGSAIFQRMGKRLRSLRTDVGMTQLELGELIGADQTYVAKYEGGRLNEIRPERIVRLAEIFDTTAGDILCVPEANRQAEQNKVLIAS